MSQEKEFLEKIRFLRKQIDFNYKGFDNCVFNVIEKLREMQEALVSCIDFDRNASFKVLDLGFGIGRTALAVLEKFPNAKIIGIDYSKKKLIEAAELFSDLSDRIELVEGDFTEIDFKINFDLIVSVIAIHQLNEKQKIFLFEKIFSHLKKGCAFINADIFDSVREDVSFRMKRVWNDYINKTIKDKFDDWWFKNIREKVKPISISEEIVLLKKTGFNSVKKVWEYQNLGVICAKK
jgi:ubiquinone/menaquinone biosynthesis C-methylase UbiE